MRVLVAVDDSGFAEDLLRAVVTGVRHENAEALVLHVLQPVASYTLRAFCRSSMKLAEWLSEGVSADVNVRSLSATASASTELLPIRGMPTGCEWQPATS